jgi:hypothetical protein
MSVHAGSILHVGGQNVIDRIQSAGLGDVRLTIETIRETGNREVVDKVPGEPDFTFTMESLDVSVETMAWLTGSYGAEASASAPGASDPDGTEYDWLDCQFVNITSPWKDPATGSAGVVEAGHLIPGYYPTRIRYRFGATDNSTQEVELSGGSFFYGESAPVEQREAGDGGTTAFPTDDPAIQYRRGGSGGSTFRSIFGVLVDGQLQTEDVDYTQSGGAADPGSTATVTFTDAPANGADIRFCYFTSAAQDYPQPVHASTIVKPGAVRGRNIRVEIEDSRIGGIQTFELEATVEGEVERELGTEDIVGRSNTGTDCNGSMVVRSKDRDAFFDLLEAVTGVARDEVFGWFNDNTVDLKIKIEDPRDPGTILKTLWVDDAKFQSPGTPARVNTPTDFSFNYESLNGTFKEVKGEPA